MAPPCKVFPAAQLEAEVQVNELGRKRKGGDIDLSACELLSMVQYDCQIDNPRAANSPVRCWPVQRLFRRCQDAKGAFTVETTKWEGLAKSEVADGKTASQTATVDHEWTNSWRESK